MQPFETTQQVFDHIVHHLLTKNKRAICSDGTYLYRTKNNLQCAIGCLIPDDRYLPSWEGTDPAFIIDQLNDLLPDNHNLEPLFENLQTMHDDVEIIVDDWPLYLRDIADDFNLEYRPPQQSN